MKLIKFTKNSPSYNVGVRLIPLGNKIKILIKGKLYCNRMKSFLKNSFTLHKHDSVILNIFKDKVTINKFLKKNRIITMTIKANDLLLDNCDIVV